MAAQMRATDRRRATSTPAARNAMRHPRQPGTGDERDVVGELHGGDRIGLGDRDRPVDGRDLRRERDSLADERGLHLLDDRFELDADRAVGADRDRRLRIVLHRRDELRMAQFERSRPDVREGVRCHEIVDSGMDQRLDALSGRALQRFERLRGSRTGAQGGDAVDHVAGELLDVDLLVDDVDDLVGDVRLDRGILRERPIRRDEGVGVGELRPSPTRRPPRPVRGWRRSG